MELVINVNLLTRVEVNPKDTGRCSQACPHIEKIRGTYKCTLFNNFEVDTGEDDELGYGFQRHIKCLALAEKRKTVND